MSLFLERISGRLAAKIIGAAISLAIIHGWGRLHDESRIPREIADVSDDRNFYRLEAVCGLYDVTGPDYREYGLQIYQIQDKDRTIVASTNNIDIDVNLVPDRFNFSWILEALGYSRYKGRFDGREVTGGIFCPPRIP